MTKILLVEDDSNLREIYGARLEAEGYEISSADDGEDALAVAVREKPDLIISDIMMPKISGFDMLDILRSTPETKDVKVIVMTALSQEEDRQRGEQLGADRYLVKSQVTLDDVVGIVRELTGGTPAPQAGTPTTDDATAQQTTGDDQVVAAQDPTTVNPTQASQPISPPTASPSSNGSTLNQEVEQFVAHSPLMNGTPPQDPAAQSSQPVESNTPEPSQPPIQTPPAS